MTRVADDLEQRAQPFLRHESIRDRHDENLRFRGEDHVSNGVTEPMLRILVNLSVELDRQPELRAVEIDDEATNDLLASELQSETASVAEHLPRATFGVRTALPQLARDAGCLFSPPLPSGRGGRG